MFNYSADQIFVVQPRGCGGGVLSLLLSLDSKTASLNFKHKDVTSKIGDWQNFCANHVKDAHVYGFVNFNAHKHRHNIKVADHCQRYVHKLHYFELDALNQDKLHPLLLQMQGPKRSIGIYLTDQCQSTLENLRPDLPPIDFYQKWIYANQSRLLPDFFGIDSLHNFSFSEMLDLEVFIDHLAYCRDILDLDIDINQSRSIIQQWYGIINNVTG